MPPSETTDSLIGRRMGAYRVEALLGEGAMGEVFRAVHEALGRPVAIKTLKPHVAADRGMLERFFAEARAVNVIRHENIVECTDMVQEPTGQSYIVMELLEGKTLGAAIREAGRMSPRRTARIGAQIADAIGAAHDKGIVHRDLKPENIFLIRRAGSPDYVKVLDFGIARLRPDMGAIGATQTGALIGTPAFMSPEQVKGERAGPMADVYALGVILYQALSGRLPFSAASVPLILAAHVTDAPIPLESLVADTPAPLLALVARCLAKTPGERPQSMAELRVLLLQSVGLPVEEHASMMLVTPAAGMPVVRSGGSGAGSSGAEAFDATVAPGTPVPAPAPPATRVAVASGVGASSVSGAAGQVGAAAPSVAPVAPAPRPRWMLPAAAIVIAGAAVAVVIAKSGTKPPSPPPAPVAAPVAAAAADAAPVAAAAPDAAPVAIAAPPDAGVAVAPPPSPKGKGKGKGKAVVTPPVVVETAPPPPIDPKKDEKKKDLTKELLDGNEDKKP